MEIRISHVWKMRIIGWLRDIILVLGMWSIWLIHEYVVDLGIMIILTWFQGVIIGIVILIKEYIISADETIQELDKELNRLKKS